MRIFLLPVSTRRTLIYCERLQAAPSTTPASQLPISERLINRAAQTWADWERADKGWRKLLVVQGNRLLSRIAFEEWGLKSLPPLTNARLKEIQDGKLQFECVYPSRFLSTASKASGTSHAEQPLQGGRDTDAAAQSLLARLAVERQSLHRRRMWTSIAWMPVSAPFTLVPIIPNIPFFYLCFRAYSHYRALYGGRLLAQLTSTPGLLAIRPSEKLDELYAKGLAEESEEAAEKLAALPGEKVDAIAREALSTSEREPEVEKMLLRPWSGRVFAQANGVPEMQVEVERAVAQVQAAIAKEAKDTKDAPVDAGTGKGEKQQ